MNKVLAGSTAAVLACVSASVAIAGIAAPSSAPAKGWDCTHAAGVTGCGWLAAPSRFAYCQLVYLRAARRLDCYSTVSGYTVGVLLRDEVTNPYVEPTLKLGRDPRYRGLRRPARVVGRTGWANDRAIDADVFCRASRRFFACDGLGVRVWFKRNGSLAVLRRDDKGTLQLWARR